MSIDKGQKEKRRLHPRNRNRERYDLAGLLEVSPELNSFVIPNKQGEDSIDFSDPRAVKSLNRALLNHYYGIKYWEFPDKHLCPPIPGRADYLHYMADVLAENNFGAIPTGEKITVLDVGVGASCIYPIIGAIEYGWKFIGTDIELESINSSKKIVEENPPLHHHVECRIQANKNDFFYGVLGKEEKIEFSMCNPPFHSSTEEAKKGTKRKVKNLTGKKQPSPQLNFSGMSNELIYDGGEYRFIHNMIRESKKFDTNCLWFSTLVSKQSNLKGIYKALDKSEAVHVKTIPMGTGNKSSRIVAWTFLTKEAHHDWRKARWK